MKKKITLSLPDPMPRPLVWIWYGFSVALFIAIVMAIFMVGLMGIGYCIHLCELYGWWAGGPILAVVFIFIGYLIETNESK